MWLKVFSWDVDQQWSLKSAISYVFRIFSEAKEDSSIRVYLNLCVHQQLKFDNSPYIVHAKRFVLIITFPTGRHLEMWRSCVVVTVSTLDKNNSNKRVGSGTATQLCHISRWRLARNSMIKTNCLAWIVCRKLSNSSTSWGKLLIEIDIVVQPRFPLTGPYCIFPHYHRDEFSVFIWECSNKKCVEQNVWRGKGNGYKLTDKNSYPNDLFVNMWKCFVLTRKLRWQV